MISKAAIPAFHALLVRTLHAPHFDPHLHYHPEYQLFVVTSGTGTRFVGDRVERFGPGDLVLIGPNLPHVWRSDEAYFQRGSALTTEGTVVYFRDVVVRDELLETHEGIRLRQLLERSANGLSFHGATCTRVAPMLRALEGVDGFARILRLLEILDVLSLSDEYEVLSRFHFPSPAHPRHHDRMDRVYSHLMGRFAEPVRLAEVARIAGMTETAFCRYFREHTNRTFTRFVAELRVGYACRLLAEEEMPVMRVGIACGYPTLSNFNRQFRELVALTPKQYRQRYGALRAAIAG